MTTYALKPRELARLLAAPFLLTAGVSLLLHLAAALGLLPPSRPTLDVDRTILIHQIEASRSRSAAEILLLGDSSCLMDVDAAALEKRLGRTTLNLGTFSYLDLEAATLFLRSYTSVNPGRVRTVVVLLHPEALRRVGPNLGAMRLLRALWEGREVEMMDGFQPALARGLGLHLLRERVLSRWLPTPLPGAYGQFYGFSTDLERYLRDHRGSALDPEGHSGLRLSTSGGQGIDALAKRFSGSAEYRLAPQQESPSRNLGAAVPEGIRLLAGITPIPVGFAESRYSDTHRRMLERWRGWLGADKALGTLPAALPDEYFASVGHLNRAGVVRFTSLLAEALRTTGVGPRELIEAELLDRFQRASGGP